MDASGNAIVVWQQSDGTRDNLWSNRYASGAWDMAQMIEHDDAGPVDVPAISVDAAGNAHAVWVQYEATIANVVGADFTRTPHGCAQTCFASACGLRVWSKRGRDKAWVGIEPA